LQDDFRTVVNVEEPDVLNGPGSADQASLIGQHRIRLLACATCLLLVGWQAPGGSMGRSGREGRVLTQIMGRVDSVEGSGVAGSGQPDRLRRHSSAADSVEHAAHARAVLALEEALSSGEDVSQHWKGEELVVGQRGRLEGHHWLPKWVRCAALECPMYA